MNITRNIVRDLLPAYFSGEATEDTRLLVEEFFRQDPDFERAAREEAQQVEALGRIGPLAPDATQEKTALKRVRNILRQQRRVFGIALALTLNAILMGLSFQLSGQGHLMQVHWLQFEFQRYVVGGLGASALVMWILYFARAQRSHM